MTSWKRIFIVSSSFGAGFAIMLSLIAGLIFWYQSQPKAWDKIAITAIYDHLDTKKKDKTFIFYYSLVNNTNIDYRFSKDSDVHVMAKLHKQESLSGNDPNFLTVESPLFLPSKQRIRFGINLQIHYEYKGEALKSDSSPEDRKKYRKKLEDYVNKEMSNLDGFVIFDDKNRFQIDFPKGW